VREPILAGVEVPVSLIRFWLGFNYFDEMELAIEADGVEGRLCV